MEESKSMWLNNIKVLKENINRTKPCHKLGYCPYGCIVEEFPLIEEKIRRKYKKDVIVNCKVFGHHCPMFYNAEDLDEFGLGKIQVEILGEEK